MESLLLRRSIGPAHSALYPIGRAVLSDPLPMVPRMASMKHEGLLSLFRNRPTLAPELLQQALGVELPAWSEARVESAEFTQVVPTEYHADLVILLLDGKPILAIVVEVQLSRDKDKRK